MVANGLIDAGFVVDVESRDTQVREWLGNLPNDGHTYKTDMLIWDADPSGSPYQVKTLRAVVEFKLEPWNVADDIAKVARILANVRPEHPRVFGFVVASGNVYPNPKQTEDDLAAVATQAAEQGPTTYQPIDSIVPVYSMVPEYKRCFGTAIGVVVNPAATLNLAA
jgi:hypothetical protein